MAYKVLQDFRGSPDGRFAVEYRKGDTVELTDSLADVALQEKWVRRVREAKDGDLLPPEVTQRKAGK